MSPTNKITEIFCTIGDLCPNFVPGYRNSCCRELKKYNRAPKIALMRSKVSYRRAVSTEKYRCILSFVSKRLLAFPPRLLHRQPGAQRLAAVFCLQHQDVLPACETAHVYCAAAALCNLLTCKRIHVVRIGAGRRQPDKANASRSGIRIRPQGNRHPPGRTEGIATLIHVRDPDRRICRRHICPI